MLEIDPFTVFQLGEHADGNRTILRGLINWHTLVGPSGSNAIAQL
ncbi:hypothetical protein CTP10_R62440 (plasmid) [Cupriavidus sp. P-10]|nr:hypothetical protein CTP10_R62440 [Cupriavidus sp. P-10]